MSSAPPLDVFSPTSRADWEARIDRDLRGRDRDRALVWDLPEGLRMDPYHRADDLDGLAHMEAGGVPRRSTSGWQRKLRIAVGGDPAGANAAARAALMDGASAIGFDLALDFDAAGYDTLLDGLDGRAAAIHAHTSPVGAGAAFLRALASSTNALGADPREVSGSLEADPLATFLRHGRMDPDAAYGDLAEVLDAAEPFAERFGIVAADARPYSQAGGDLVQEAAFVLAALSEHLAQLSDRGVSPARVAPRAHLIVPVGTRFLPELAKLRALRVLAAQVFAAYGVPDAPAITLQATTAHRALTLADPHTNLLRGTTAAVCAVLAGCDTLEVTPYDALTGDTAQGHRLARTTQLLLAHEAHLGTHADPAAGAYSIEVLTDGIARAAWSLFQEIEAEGGLLRALNAGTVQAVVAEARKSDAETLARRRRVLIGTSDFPRAGELLPEPVALPSYGPSALGAPLVIAPLPRLRDAEPFEALRRRVQALTSTPLAYCVLVGTPAIRAARAAFAQNLLGVAGFRVEVGAGSEDAAEGARAARDAGADFAILCAPDEMLPEAFTAFTVALGQDGPLPLVAAPPTALPQAKPAAYIHRRADVLKTLGTLVDRIADR